MLIENMKMAFSAIRANKMRSALTMLGIIIGIGSVISIVSIGDTMRGLFADLYKDVGITQAYFSIGYWVDDVRQSDYFNLDEMERARRPSATRLRILTAAPLPAMKPPISGQKSSSSTRALITITRMYSRWIWCMAVI